MTNNTHAFNLYRYAIPMRSDWILRNRKLAVREGLLLELQVGEQRGWGEIAPLSGFSHETLTQAQQQAFEWLTHWQRRGNPPADLDQLFPSVAFGISCALAELQQRLTPTATFQTVALSDGKNLDKNTPLDCVKIKVGIADPKAEGKQINHLLTEHYSLKLRLDANQKWTLQNALSFAQAVEFRHFSRIEFIEEPCQTASESLSFSAQTQMPIAWDESLRTPSFRLQAVNNLTAIIIKPTLTGSLERCIQLIHQAHQLGLQAVISSSLESSFGLTQLARIAQQYTPKTLAGLDTLNLMNYQLIRPWPTCTLPICNFEHRHFIWKISSSS